MKTAINLLFATVSLALITACGGGSSGGSTTVAPVASPSTFNAASAIEKLFTTDANVTSGNTRISMSAAAPELINGITYNVQNVLVLENGITTSSKRYFTQNPFTIFRPQYFYNEGALTLGRVFVTATTRALPTAVKYDSFGVFETLVARTCTALGQSSCAGTSTSRDYTISWSASADTVNTIQFCYGMPENSNLSPYICYIINTNNTVVSFTL